MKAILTAGMLALATTSIFTGSAQADWWVSGLKNVSFSAEVLDEPITLTFIYSDGQWKLGKGGKKQKIKFHIKAESKRKQRIKYYDIYHTKPQPSLKITKVQNFSLKKLDKVIVHEVTNSELQKFIPAARYVCETQDIRDKVHKAPLLPQALYSMTIRSESPSLNGSYYDQKVIHRSVPYQVICKPGSLKVENIKLSVKYDKKPGACKAHLKAVLKTNRKSKQDLSFWLLRKDGNKQKINVKTNNDGTAYFNKSYTIKNSVDREYIVTHKNTTSKWTSMKLNCPLPIEVKKVSIKMKYKTLPGNCKTRVLLRASLKTNQTKPVDLSFWLYRKDGAKQKITVKTRSKDGYAIFDKIYNFNGPVNREYMAAFVDGKAKTSSWTPMKVKCSLSNSGGFQKAPASQN